MQMIQNFSSPASLQLPRRRSTLQLRMKSAVIVRASSTPPDKSNKVVKSTPKSPKLSSGDSGIHKVESAYWDAASEANTWYPAPPPSKKGDKAGDKEGNEGNFASPHLHSDDAKKPTYGSSVISHSESPNTASSTDAYWDAAAQNEYTKGTNKAESTD